MLKPLEDQAVARLFLLRADLVNAVECCKWFLFLTLLRSRRGFFSNRNCDNMVKLQEIKFTKDV